MRAKVWWTEGQSAEYKFEPIADFRSFAIKQSNKPPKSILLGAGFIETRPNYSAEDVKNLRIEDLQIISRYNEDFMVLKFDVTENVPCFRIPKLPLKQEKIWSVGYPSAIASSIQKLEIVAGLSANRPLELFESKAISENPAEDSIFDWSKMGAANTPLQSGMSGGPVINQKGDAIGINVISVGDVSYFVRLSYVRDQVTSFLGKNAAQNVFNCR